MLSFLVVFSALVLLLTGVECRGDEVAVSTPATTNSAKAGVGQTQFLCPQCQGVSEAIPRFGGPVTPDDYNLHLAGKAVADGSCVGSRTVFVCRQCGKYSADGIHAWNPLPPRFGSQPHAADTNAEPGSAANRSQPASSDTNRPPAAAGSDR